MSMKNKGPGPAAYALPTEVGYNQHDPRKDRKPMYSMRPTFKKCYETTGPGPATYDLKKQTRVGGPRGPKYSLGSSIKPMKEDLIPGPGAHNNHLVPTMKCKRPPLHSFGQRFDVKNNEIIPAPNRYNGLIYMTRLKAPCYSLGIKTKEIQGLEGPGPNRYGATSRDVTHRRAPCYGMREAHKDIKSQLPHPAPNCYGLMNLRVGSTAPSYSFGIQYPNWKDPMIIPGDNC
ncbi:outer dense fiber protein 3-like protein 2 [Anopheles moucheti]|uniref:outer dense fiber protein 3-like protein 2 n=1 Tax=Anopheles moucheti TaxID=186751 RepID=UPI0022F0BD95|nr:outer dense fiber protein 3-like protein 2 [Anopheles moucheti]